VKCGARFCLWTLEQSLPTWSWTPVDVTYSSRFHCVRFHSCLLLAMGIAPCCPRGRLLKNLGMSAATMTSFQSPWGAWFYRDFPSATLSQWIELREYRIPILPSPRVKLLSSLPAILVSQRRYNQPRYFFLRWKKRIPRSSISTIGRPRWPVVIEMFVLNIASSLAPFRILLPYDRPLRVELTSFAHFWQPAVTQGQDWIWRKSL